MQRENFSKLVEKLPKPVLLNEKGENKIGSKYQTFILGDDKDPTDDEMKILNSLDKVKIGETSLLTSACITLIHHFLDE
jgi:tRNA pseudouridine-54 N-methylase